MIGAQGRGPQKSPLLQITLNSGARWKRHLFQVERLSVRNLPVLAVQILNREILRERHRVFQFQGVLKEHFGRLHGRAAQREVVFVLLVLLWNVNSVR